MRVKIEHINELTDSREILESNPNPFVPIFISILVALILGLLTWSYFGKIDTVAKANGSVRPNEKVHTLQAPIMGTVETTNLKEGKKVEKGELLFSLNQEEVTKELENRRTELKEVEDELAFLVRYKESVQTRENAFDGSNEREKHYRELVEQYIVNYQQLDLGFDSSTIETVQKKNELEQSAKLIEVNLKQNEQKVQQDTKVYKAEKESVEKNITHITRELSNEKELRKAIVSNSSTLTVNDSIRQSKLETYQKRVEQLTIIVENYEKTYNRSLELGERFVSRSQLEKEKSLYDNARLDLEIFRVTTLKDLDSSIKSYEEQIKQAESDLKNLIKLTDLTVYNEALYIEKQHIAQNIEDMKRQESLLNQSIKTTLKKFEIDKLVEINQLIEATEDKKIAIQENIEHLEILLNKGNVTASTSGTVNIVRDISPGELLQAGEKILSIIPDEESQYKVMLFVPNQEIGKIEVGNEVNFHFTAFPKKDYGYLTGKVNSISSDSIIGENGISYYIVETSLKNNALTNRKGEQVQVMVGMTVEASVITDSKKILHYLLEKINFID